ncbi:MAG: hybrid sensor histidine kinase/response regulator [Myxococcales bacterium]|nr:hybrid sensor histidine kinase/response regulator [Myxococcales bacterium]
MNALPEGEIIRVLLVEDDEDDYVLLDALIRDLPHWRLERVSSSAEARERLAENVHDVCLLDYRLDADDGLAVLKDARKLGFEGPLVMLTGAADRSTDLAAMEAGASDYLVKGSFDAPTLDRAIRYALSLNHLARERVARAEAEASHRVKDELVAMVSHELRAPLHTMRMAVELIGDADDVPAHHRHPIAALGRGVTRLTRLIEDLLDITRIERGELALARQKVDLAEVARQAESGLRLRHPDLELTLDLEPAPLRGDAVRLEQVVDNLVDNAVKHGRRTPVEVRVRAEGEHVTLEVRDHGPGVPEDLIPHVFELFRQRRRAKGRGAGLGLGLGIAKAIVEAHGGELTVHNDGGAVFVARLPSK